MVLRSNIGAQVHVKTQYITSGHNRTLSFLLCFDYPTTLNDPKFEWIRQSKQVVRTGTQDQTPVGLRISVIQKSMLVGKMGTLVAFGLQIEMIWTSTLVGRSENLQELYEVVQMICEL